MRYSGRVEPPVAASPLLRTLCVRRKASAGVGGVRVGPRGSGAILRLLSGPLYGRLQLGYARRQSGLDPPVLPVRIALLVELPA
jgi:hypothetical protein